MTIQRTGICFLDELAVLVLKYGDDPKATPEDKALARYVCGTIAALGDEMERREKLRRN